MRAVDIGKQVEFRDSRPPASKCQRQAEQSYQQHHHHTADERPWVFRSRNHSLLIPYRLWIWSNTENKDPFRFNDVFGRRKFPASSIIGMTPKLFNEFLESDTTVCVDMIFMRRGWTFQKNRDNSFGGFAVTVRIRAGCHRRMSSRIAQQLFRFCDDPTTLRPN